MRVSILGSGSPRPSAKRANSSYLIEVGEDRILFDHGFGAGQRLIELGVPAHTISHVFLSHHHYDHMGDLARLILTRWDQMRDDQPELRLYGPPPLARIVDRLIGKDGAFAVDLRARIESACSRELNIFRGGTGERSWPRPEVCELQPGERVDSPGWSVTCAEAIHCPTHLHCLGYRIEAGGKSLVYSGDTGPSACLGKLASGADTLIFMCSQATSNSASPVISESIIGHLEVAELAANAKVQRLILTHIEHLEDEATRDRVLAEMSEIYPGSITIANDLLAFEVGEV